jgi:uncharacterized coiled-coil protein SlyX
MSWFQKALELLTVVQRLNEKIDGLSSRAAKQQQKIEELTERVIKLEAANIDQLKNRVDSTNERLIALEATLNTAILMSGNQGRTGGNTPPALPQGDDS